VEGEPERERGAAAVDACSTVHFTSLPPQPTTQPTTQSTTPTNPNLIQPQRVTDVLKDPTLLTSSLVGEVGGRVDERLLARLRTDIVRCARADRSYSPFSDMAKTLAGACSGRGMGDGCAAGWPDRTYCSLLLLNRPCTHPPHCHQDWSMKQHCTQHLSMQV